MQLPEEGQATPFEYDLMTMLCCLLKETGPIEFTGEEVNAVGHQYLTIETVVGRDAYILRYDGPSKTAIESRGE